MKLVLTVITAIILLSCNRQPKPVVYTSEMLFFNIDPKASFSEVVKFCRNTKSFKEVEPAGWTSYPPLSALSNAQANSTPTFRTFRFKNHTGLPDEFKSGDLL